MKAMLFPMVRLMVVVGVVMYGALVVVGAEYRWNGAGISGGTGDNDWGTAGNWEFWNGAAWVVATEVPGSADVVMVEFDASSIPEFALVIPDGAEAGHLTLAGLTSGSDDGIPRNRQVLFAGNTALGSLRVEADGGTSPQFSNVFIAENQTVTLVGGDEVTPTLWVTNAPGGTARRTIIDGDGVLAFSGSEVYYQGSAMLDVNVVFSHSTATINIIGGEIGNMKPTTYHVNQTVNGLDRYFLVGDLVSETGVPLTQFGDVIINFGGGASSAIQYNADATIAPGEYGAFYASSTAAGSGGSTLRLGGDVEVLGEVSGTGGIPGVEDDRFSIYVNRSRTNGAQSFIITNGYDLNVTSPHRVQIGDELLNVNASRSELDLRSVVLVDESVRSTTAWIAGDFMLGHSGALLGDEHTVMHVRGAFLSESIRNTFTEMDTMTLVLDGLGTSEAPQYLEVMGSDQGTHGAGDLPLNNFAIGSLVIGAEEQATYVTLTDLFHFDEIDGDALYVGSLLMQGGSTLNLNGLSLYVDGTLLEGGENFGNGTIVIPEWKMGGVLFALALGYLHFRRRREG